jgi:hypothetical protein
VTAIVGHIDKDREDVTLWVTSIAGSHSHRPWGPVLGQPLKEPVKVSAGVAPVEGGRGLLVVALEGQEAALDLEQVTEVVGREHFALNHREVDFYLIEPGCADGQVDQAQVAPLFLQPVDRRLAPVGAAIVDHPEHPPGGRVGLGGHDLFHEPPKRVDPSRQLAAAKQARVVHVPGRQVGQRAPALVLMLHPHHAGLGWWQGRVAAAARLNRGLSSALMTYSSAPSSAS